MASHDMNTMMTGGEMFVELVAKPFRAIGNALVFLAENSVYAKSLEELNATSDEELAERGLTRAEAAQLIFRNHI